MIEYRQRLNAFSSERSYVLEAEALRCESGGEPVILIPFEQIEQVQLSFDPTRVQRDRYRLRIRGQRGQQLDISNQHYAGFANFEDRSPSYRYFVSGLHKALVDGGHRVAYRSGNSSLQYAGNLLLSLFLLLVLVVATWFLLLVGMIVIVLLKLLIIAFYLPTLYRYLARNRPRSYSPSNIPQDVLPPLPDSPPPIPVK